jgi:hypothetical protein
LRHVLNWLILIVGLGLVTYRVTRFVVLDSLIDRPRDAVHNWLMSRGGGWGPKLAELVGCPWCVSVWISAGAVALTMWLTDHEVIMPVWTWLAIAAVAVLWYNVTDAED